MSFPIFFLLQDSSGAASPAGPSMLPWFIGIAAIFIFMMVIPQRKEQKKRIAMLQGVKKHDRVLMNCGLYGSVVAVDEQTITLKVDDSTNTRMKFSRSAIAGIVTADGEKVVAEDAKASGSAAPRS